MDAKLPEMVIVLAALLATPVPPLAAPSVPVTPVLNGKPVALVKTPALGVPKLGVVRLKLAASMVLVTVAESPEVITVPLVAGTLSVIVEAVLAPTRLI